MSIIQFGQLGPCSFTYAFFAGGEDLLALLDHTSVDVFARFNQSSFDLITSQDNKVQTYLGQFPAMQKLSSIFPKLFIDL